MGNNFDAMIKANASQTVKTVAILKAQHANLVAEYNRLCDLADAFLEDARIQAIEPQLKAESPTISITNHKIDRDVTALEG